MVHCDADVIAAAASGGKYLIDSTKTDLHVSMIWRETKLTRLVILTRGIDLTGDKKLTRVAELFGTYTWQSKSIALSLLHLQTIKDLAVGACNILFTTMMYLGLCSMSFAQSLLCSIFDH
jgi:hypothetical protein